MNTPLTVSASQTFTLNSYDLATDYSSYCGLILHELILTDGGTTYLTMTTDATDYTFTLNSVVEADIGPHTAQVRSYF